MERYNPKLAELPNHKHYPNCLARKTEIEENCQIIFTLTLGVGILFFMLTLFSLRFAVISWIPALLGEADEMLPFLVQEATVLFIVLLAGLNCGKRKLCGVILLFIYLFMAVFGFICSGENVGDYLTAIIGVIGTFCSLFSVRAYTDWKQLVNTEGFPYFSVKVTEADEHPEYEPQYTGTGATDSMSPAEKTAPMKFTGLDVQLDMPELPSLSQIKAYRDTSVTEVEFVQEGEKYCCISESPIKII